jgi:DNA-binding NarL/FixJ family response regulator
MTQQNKIRLLIADDHDVVRSGLKSMLEGAEIKVVGEVATGQAAVAYVLKNEVDVVLLDVRMADSDGLNTLGRIRLDKPHLPILMLSYSDNPAYVARAVALGANGYLLKSCTREELLAAVKTAASGQNTWTRAKLRHITGALSTPRLGPDVEVALTDREGQVLKHLAAGLTNKQLAEKLEISPETVKEHVQHVLGKIGVSDRTQAAVWAVRHGLA